MTQDQYGEGREVGYGVRDDVETAETGEYPEGQARPMTRFQKVASALLGGSGRDELDQPAADPVTGQAAGAPPAGAPPAGAPPAGAPPAGAPPAGLPWEAQRGAATQPQRDYWDEPGTPADGRDEAAAVTSPDAPAMGTPAMGTPAAQAGPDMFGTTGATSAPAAEVTKAPGTSAGQGAAATSPDVPAAGTPASGATGVQAGAAAGTAGRNAAPAATESSAMLGDFSDLTYGDLIPDAARYTDQWHQIQYKFVDDPHASVTEAADIVAQVTARLEAAIQERQRAIAERQRAITEQQRTLRGRWGEGSNADTEVLRETLCMYRTFLDQLIGRRAGSSGAGHVGGAGPS